MITQALSKQKMSGIQFHLPWKTSHNSPIYARLTQQSGFGPHQDDLNHAPQEFPYSID